MTEPKKHLIMLVEDEDSLRYTIRRILTSLGYDTEDYSHGLAAHRRLAELHTVGKSHQYGIILSDIDMPEMDGIAFAREAHILAPKTPFFLMTGKPRSSYPESVKEVIEKPFNRETLKRAISKYLV